MFQSMHMLWHRTQGIECYHVVQTNGGNIILTESHNHCPICEYQFSINDVTDIYYSEIKLPESLGDFQVKATAQYYILIPRFTNTRGPPA